MASDRVPRSTALYDNETGEANQRVICLRTDLGSEANKPAASRLQESDNIDKNRFRVPSSLISPTRREPSLDIKASKIDTQNFTVAFLLPTLLLFPAWASILCAIGEASVHIWSHKRNKMKKEFEEDFKSPLNLISSEFCAKCRSEKSMQKIGKIQDKRTKRRSLINRTFIKQAVQ